eukprot:1757728-Pyramimonas_sp.AAC.1
MFGVCGRVGDEVVTGPTPARMMMTSREQSLLRGFFDFRRGLVSVQVEACPSDASAERNDVSLRRF